MAIRPLRGRRVLQASVAVVAAALLRQLPFGLLLLAPLLLPQQLLGLQEDPGVDAAAAAGAASVAVPGPLVAGVPGVVLGRLEAFAGRVGLVPGVLGDGAGVLPGLPAVETPENMRGFLGMSDHPAAATARKHPSDPTDQNRATAFPRAVSDT